MKPFLLHTQTNQSLDKFINSPSHAVIIEGELGSGRHSVCGYICEKLIGSKDYTNDTNILVVEPEDRNITIEQIRESQKFIKLKTVGIAEIRRVLVFDIKDKITLEAQNSFLKILEEPPLDTVIILITSPSTKLLPTVKSRAQLIKVLPVALSEAISFHAKNGLSKEKVTQAYHISDARADIINSFLLEDNRYPQINQVNSAKDLLSKDRYEKLIFFEKFSKDKKELKYFVDALLVIASSGIKSASKSGNHKQLKSWHRLLEICVITNQRLGINPNVKLLTTDLAMQI